MATYTVTEAAVALCVQPGTVHKWIRTGRLRARADRNARGGIRWLVTDLTVTASGTPQHWRDDALDFTLAHAEISLTLPEWRAADWIANGRCVGCGGKLTGPRPSDGGKCVTCTAARAAVG